MKIKNYKKFITIYETGKEIITLGDTEVKKHKFHQYKGPISINDADISKIVGFVLVKKVLNILLGTKIVKK